VDECIRSGARFIGSNLTFQEQHRVCSMFFILVKTTTVSTVLTVKTEARVGLYEAV